jgi:nucleotide-binding universal stress UspA family protein
MKRILVPVDFSDCSENAAISAANIAAASNASLFLLHSVDTPVDWVKLPKSKEDLYPETKEKIAKALSSFEALKNRKELKKLKVETHLTYNIAHDDIVAHAKEFKADLIVMGTHGTSGFSKYWIGSNTTKVIRVSKTPVLSVKCDPLKANYKKIIFATNFEEEVGKPFKKVLDLADITGAEVELLYVNTPADFRDTAFMEAIMDEFCAEYPKRKFKRAIYNAYSVQEGIVKHSKNTGADIIALATHGSSGFFNPAITEKVVNKSDIPVMSINIFQ